MSATEPTRLDGKVAVVTGAARGVGLAVADVLARQGASVAVADVLDLAAAVTAVEARDQQALAVPTDVREPEQVTRLMDEATARFGGVDLLVCCAAVYGAGDFESIDEEDWKRVIDINLYGTFLCLKAAFREMRKRGGGSIVTVGSVAGITGGHASGPQYAASKGGVHAMSRWAAGQGAPDIRVNVLVPGAIATDMIKGLGYETDISPMRRQGEPAEIAEMAAFLVSDAASYMTGASVEVHGGYLMH